MFRLKDTLVSEELLENEFSCNLSACKGACCVAGEAGAPVDRDEIPKLESIQEDIRPFLRTEGIEAIEAQGVAVKNDFDEYETPLVNGAECAYATFTDNGTALCGIETAYREDKIDWKKPLSCELYPVRAQKLGKMTALNYHEWDICDPACELGKQLDQPIYKFVKDALIKKYGEEYYAELEEVAEDYKASSQNSDSEQ